MQDALADLQRKAEAIRDQQAKQQAILSQTEAHVPQHATYGSVKAAEQALARLRARQSRSAVCPFTTIALT